ncbi:endonuclease III [Candidatus Contubernalis alkaliaceticus]|uniref:endonuclease III n=1 Tax=Candidatus Contubernalis alkaliaceticus TaxID=338645 RepID=UPI001F4C1FC0|nr:endonuclease III [Candidatus Contubernalis alkalaceticus]UNC92358.1 endonuclease III [Candidatus Contubernalis alkalaceticus]
MNKNEAAEILKLLDKMYPNPRTDLLFNNSFELLIAVMLSAQTTDKQVNRVTEKLFKKYPTPWDFINLTPEELEKDIKKCGLFRNKSRNIVTTANIIVQEYNGKVPDRLEQLLKLPGVGRKTASVVLANAFGIPAFPVDTHVYRVSYRLGLAGGKNPLVTEKELKEIIPESLWNKAHHWLIAHGRTFCSARRPQCQECPLLDYCKNGKKNIL